MMIILTAGYEKNLLKLLSIQRNSKSLASIDIASERFRVGEEKLNNKKVMTWDRILY